ncbi:MAG: hypothetical protein ABIQ72_17715 [Usitatibacter sp.]
MSRTTRRASMSAALATLLLAGFVPHADAASLGGCKCDDVREMRDRWCSARAARSEYERLQSRFESETARTGKPRMFSNADKNMMNDVCAQEAINSTSDQGVPKATGKTRENFPLEGILKEDCRVEVSGSDLSACQKQIIEGHENLHSLACFARNAMFKDYNINVRTKLQAALYGASNMAALNLTGDTKYMMTMAQYAAEEAAGYATEAQLISYRWTVLQQACQSQAFEIEVEDESKVGKNLWDKLSTDSNGKKIYKMYDLSSSPCPYRPRPSPSQCTIK